MTAAYLVSYEGRPRDPDPWLRHYLDEHVPLLWRFPDIRGVEVHIGQEPEDAFIVVRLLFDDLMRLRAAITSEERAVARKDMEDNLLPGFDGRVRHQVTEVRVFPPPG
jgi:uncharacterized protein (TIGR02118 family)